MLVVAVLMAKIVQTGSYVVIARTTSIDELGRAAIVQAWSNGVLVLIVPLVILIVMLKLHRAIWHPASVIRTA